MFIDTNDSWGNLNTEIAIYTLADQDKEVDGKLYPSLKRLYLELCDPTEYLFATTYLGGWDHFQELANAVWFGPHLSKWRNEVEVKIKADAFNRILVEALSDGRNAFSANKFIIDKAWVGPAKDSARAAAGRPSKQAIKEAAHQIATERANLNDDFERLEEIAPQRVQ